MPNKRQAVTWNKFQWKSNQNSIIFVQENAFEIVVCHFVQGEMSEQLKVKSIDGYSVHCYLHAIEPHTIPLEVMAGSHSGFSTQLQVWNKKV